MMYKIECEWDIGLDDLYTSKEAAMADIKAIDWVELLEEPATVEQLIEEGLLAIKPVNIKK